MQIFVIALACVITVLALIWAFFRAAYVLGRLSGFDKLLTHYAYSGPPPTNARNRTFCVGFVGNSTGSAGSCDTGLYLHGGLLGGSVLIPWDEVRSVAHFGKFTMLRTRRTGVSLLLSSELCERSLVAQAQAS